MGKFADCIYSMCFVYCLTCSCAFHVCVRRTRTAVSFRDYVVCSVCEFSGKFFFDSCRDIERYGSYRICSYIFIGEHCHITSIDYLFVGCCAGYAAIWSMDSSVIGPKFSSSVCSDRRVSYAKEIRVIRFIIAEYCNIKI